MLHFKIEFKPISGGRYETIWTWGDWRKGTAKQWAKVIKGVDLTKQGGWAFEGDFVRVGTVMNEGEFIGLVISNGSHRHPNSTFYLYRCPNPTPLLEMNYNTQGERERAAVETAKILAATKTQTDQTQSDFPPEVIDAVETLAKFFGLTTNEVIERLKR